MQKAIDALSGRKKCKIATEYLIRQKTTADLKKFVKAQRKKAKKHGRKPE